MKKSYKNGFTLVELLAVIVILAIILVIAVPKIMDVINSSKKSTLETSVKMIASAAEKTKMQNTILGKENEEITCNSVAKLSSSDYENCTIKFDGNTAKVTVKGKGKFEGLNVCGGTKNSATAQTNDCPVPSFANDDWNAIIAAVQSGEYPYEVGDTKRVDLGPFGTHTLRIANTTPCSEAFPKGTDGKSETACGFVLEFADIITMHNMNSTNTNVGGWPASDIFNFLNYDSNGIYNSLQIELRDAIIDTKVISSHREIISSSTETSNSINYYNNGLSKLGTYYWLNSNVAPTILVTNYETKDSDNYITKDVKLYLLSPEEVWDDWSDSSDSARGTSRQLDYYSNLGVSTSNCSYAGKTLNGEAKHWWLRTTLLKWSYNFYCISGNGSIATSGPNSSNGVSPAFRLAE